MPPPPNPLDTAGQIDDATCRQHRSRAEEPTGETRSLLQTIRKTCQAVNCTYGQVGDAMPQLTRMGHDCVVEPYDLRIADAKSEVNNVPGLEVAFAIRIAVS
jgi:hypothetical protein